MDSGAEPVEVITLATQRDPSRIYDDILVLSAGRYVGTVSMRSLLAHHKGLLVDSLAEVAVLDERAKRLEAVNRIQKEFMANMTHELRAPLNVLLGLVRVTADDPQLAAGHRHGLEVALARGQELLGIVNDVLDAARLEAGALQPLTEPVQLPALLDDVVEGLRPLLAGRKVELRRRFTSLPERFMTDPVFVRRVLTNLIGNAVKFTAAGTVTLHAEGRPEGVILAVADTGRGIAADDLPRLFTRFVQLDSGPGRRHGGTGLGLAIVKGLVEQLGGTVEAASRPGQGSIFTVRLPQPRAHTREES